VRWSETNADGWVDITSYLRYLVETAWDWGAAGGLSLEECESLGLAWVMRETQFNLHRPLHYDDRFDFTIWLLQWRRVRGTRVFELKLQDGGEVVAQGAQQVVLLDGQTMRPTSPPEQVLDYYRLEDPRILPVQRFPRVPPPPESAFVMERRVEERDLDQLGIVDNTVFGAHAEEAAARALSAAGWSPAKLRERGLAVAYRRFHILHQAPAEWGDRLAVSAYLSGLDGTGGEWVITTERPADGAPIGTCILGWMLVDRATGDARSLPESLRVELSRGSEE